MKYKLSAILMASVLAATMLFASCSEKSSGQPSKDTTVETNAKGEETVTIGALEKADNGLHFRLYTEKSGDRYYAVVGLGTYAEKTVTIPNTFRDLPVKLVADGAFDNSDKITEVVIPDSVVTLGERAFGDCNELKIVTIGNGVQTIGGKAFFTCNQLTTVNFGTAVESIGYQAFYGCSSLKELTLPQQLSKIGEHAFWGCYSLEKIQIFDGLTSIGRDAFYACSALKPTEQDGAYYLGNNDNPYLMLISVKDKSVAEYTVHSNVKYVGQTALANCEALTKVTLPAGVTVLAEGALQHCEKLVNIQFQGTSEDWNNVSKGYLWDYETGNYTVTCSDGTVAKA